MAWHAEDSHAFDGFRSDRCRKRTTVKRSIDHRAPSLRLTGKDFPRRVVGNWNIAIGRNFTCSDERVVAGTTHPKERGKVAEVVIGIHRLVPEPRYELRDGHSVAQADFAERIPEMVLDPDRGGDPVDAQTVSTALPLAGVGLDEEFAYRRGLPSRECRRRPDGP